MGQRSLRAKLASTATSSIPLVQCDVGAAAPSGSRVALLCSNRALQRHQAGQEARASGQRAWGAWDSCTAAGSGRLPACCVRQRQRPPSLFQPDQRRSSLPTGHNASGGRGAPRRPGSDEHRDPRREYEDPNILAVGVGSKTSKCKAGGSRSSAQEGSVGDDITARSSRRTEGTRP